MDITRNYHKGNKYSQEAFRSATPQKKANDKMKIRAMMLRVGPKRGVTSDEAEVELNMPHQTCSARFSDMKRDDELVHVGERETRTGNKAGAWTLVRLLVEPKS
jgi:hypothetical protein